MSYCIFKLCICNIDFSDFAVRVIIEKSLAKFLCLCVCWFFDIVRIFSYDLIASSSKTICTFLTLTNSFKLYDQNEALTAGRPIEILADGSQVKTTSMIAKNIVDNFAETYASSNGTAQAKAVLFFLVVVAISLLQLYLTRRKEIEQ